MPVNGDQLELNLYEANYAALREWFHGRIAYELNSIAPEEAGSRDGLELYIDDATTVKTID